MVSVVGCDMQEAVRVFLTAQRLRSLRALEALEVLEPTGSSEARAVLRKLAGGMEGTWLSEAAGEAFRRLKSHVPDR
jgi:hypothetical protein